MEIDSGPRGLLISSYWLGNFYFLLLLILVLFSLNLTASLLAILEVHQSVSSLSFVLFACTVSIFFYYPPFLLLFLFPLPPLLLPFSPLLSSLMMCLAFKAFHCCITGLFVSPSCKERKRCNSSGRGEIFLCTFTLKSNVWMCSQTCTHKQFILKIQTLRYIKSVMWNYIS